ncbi:MAG: hypothetical protein QXP80_04500 [Zestosphaera sp.]
MSAREDSCHVLGRLLEVIVKWSEENLSRHGWFVSDPESYEWWGGFRDPFEISVSAILVQLSRWEVVDEALERLRGNGLLNPYTLSEIDLEVVKKLVRGVGFYETKSMVLREFSQLVVSRGGWNTFINRDLTEVREDLTSLRGVGPETADTILLFAGNKPVLPVSRLARRVLSRIGLEIARNYTEAQKLLENCIPRNLRDYKTFHAALVSIAKTYCRIKKPLCVKCPLNTLCTFNIK